MEEIDTRLKETKIMANNYNNAFKMFAKQAPLVATERWLYGVWMVGNNYRSKQKYYGEYPPMYLERIYSLFPKIKSDSILHLFSGSLDDTEKGDRFDINIDLNPTYIGDAHELSKIVPINRYRLIIVDPPYSQEDANHYGIPMINRNKVIIECCKVLMIDGYIVWLDQVLPMYRKRVINLIGTIGLIRSTNHRVRFIFIWKKVGDYIV